MQCKEALGKTLVWSNRQTWKTKLFLMQILFILKTVFLFFFFGRLEEKAKVVDNSAQLSVQLLDMTKGRYEK